MTTLLDLPPASITLRSDVTVALIDSMGTDRSVVAAAKVSTEGIDSLDTLDEEANAGLINFLSKNRHGTPFEHNAMTFFVRAPIFVFREFHRHRIGWSYNEESARYKQLDGIFWVPAPDRPLCQVGKPGHYTYVPGTDAQHAKAIARMTRCYSTAYYEYVEMLRDGIAREVARSVLPVATYSSMYATCNARSLMSFLSLRTKDPDATFPSFPQQEIEDVARAMEAHFEVLFPIVHAAFRQHGSVSP